jgi:hypothetical protein
MVEEGGGGQQRTSQLSQQSTEKFKNHRSTRKENIHVDLLNPVSDIGSLFIVHLGYS